MEYNVKYITHDSLQTITVLNELYRRFGEVEIDELQGPHEITIDIKPIIK